MSDQHTRRTALTLLAAAAPLGAEPQKSSAHPVVFFEIGCRDLAKTQHFYTDLFGWNMTPAPISAKIDTGSSQGVQGQMVSLGHEPQHYTMFYVEVDDVKAALDKATALGGKVLVPPVKIPTGVFGWFADLEGNMVGVLKRS